MSLQCSNSILYGMIDDVLHLKKKTTGSVLGDDREPNLMFELIHEYDAKLYAHQGKL